MPDDTDAPTCRYSLVERREDNAPEGHTSTLAELADQLRRHGNIYENKNGPGFLPATFENGRRANEDVECVHWLALDIEDTAGTVDALQGPLTGYQRIVYSTWSHGDPAKWDEGEPRFRVLIPLETPVGPEAYRALWQHIYELLDGAPDAGCKDPARLMYTPRRRNPEATIDPWLELHEDGPPIDPEALPAGDGEFVSADRLVAQQKARRGDNTPFEPPKSLGDAPWIADALEHIDPDLDYDQWRNVGIALKTAFGNEAFEVFDDWSTKGNKYAGPLGCRQKWVSFPHQSPEDVTGDGVSLGTIWHLAKNNGWTPPADAYPASVRRGEMHNPREGTDPIDLDGAQAKVSAAVGDALEQREGRYYIDADPGTGKTYSTLRELALAVARGDVETFKYVTPTNDVLDEKLEDFFDQLRDVTDPGTFNELADQTAIQPKRTANSCARFGRYRAFESVAEDGGRAFCHQQCELHPDRMENPELQCPFIRERREKRGARFQFTTAEMEKRTRGKGLHENDTERREIIRWTETLRMFLPIQGDLGADVPTFSGRLETTPKQRALTVQYDPDGREPPELEEGDEYVLEAGTPKVTAVGKRRIREWLADTAPYPLGTADDELFGYYRREAADAEFDAMILDESMIGVMHGAVSATRHDFQQWCEHDDLEGEVGWLEGVLKALQHDVRNENRLADLLPSPLEAGDNETGKVQIQNALERVGDRAAVDAVESAPDWRALEAIEWASENDWRGCYIRDGELVVPYVHRLDLEQADLVLCLDATGDPKAAKAVLGERYEHIAAHVERPESTNVQRIDWQLTHKPQGKDVERHEGLLSAPRFRGNRHLHVTRKDLNPNVPDDERSAEAADDRRRENERHVAMTRRALDLENVDHVTHFGGTATRGSNAYESCDSATLASWYLPPEPIQQRAAVLSMLTGDDVDDCEPVARWQMEGAEYVQAAHRSRLLNGNVTITYCDTRTIPGLEPDQVLERAELDRIGAEHTGDLSGWRGDHVAAELLHDLVDQAGAPIFANSPREDGGISHCTLALHIEPLCRVRVHLEIPEVKAAIRGAFKNRWDASWHKAADAAGLHCARLETSEGGAGRCVLSADPIDAEAVKALVDEADPDWRWYEYDRDRVWLDDTDAELRSALAELGDVDDFVELSAGEKRELVGDLLDVSASTVYRRMNEADWSTADLEDTWCEMHTSGPETEPDEPSLAEDLREHHGPPPSVVELYPRTRRLREHLEERAAVFEYRDGMERAEAEQKAAERVRSEQIRKALDAADERGHIGRIPELYDRLAQTYEFSKLHSLPLYTEFVDRLWCVREEFYQTCVNFYDDPVGDWEAEAFHWSELNDRRIRDWAGKGGVSRELEERIAEWNDFTDHEPKISDKLVQRFVFAWYEDTAETPAPEGHTLAYAKAEAHEVMARSYAKPPEEPPHIMDYKIDRVESDPQPESMTIADAERMAAAEARRVQDAEAEEMGAVLFSEPVLSEPPESSDD